MHNFQIYLGKTKIRHDPDGPDCVKILGFDANALYKILNTLVILSGLYDLKEHQTIRRV